MSKPRVWECNWQICREFSIVQAALIIAGLEPTELQYHIENVSPSQRPPAYEAARASLVNSVKSNNLPASYICKKADGSLDLMETTILSKDLKAFCLERKKAIESNEESDQPSYLDPKHDHYSPKLAATVNAWLAMQDKKLLKKTTPQRALKKWLDNHATEYLKKNDDKDVFTPTAKKECARIANWKPGGAAETPS